jgi:phospholipid/cholesterol/gamma-HCH transport system substrate-binding protein
MKDQRKTEIKVGITVIAGTLIFIWILGWAKNFSFTSNEKIVTVEFHNVSGLEVGDYVMVNGVREGNVEDMSVKGDDVFVKLSIDKSANLKKDATFDVSMLDLMGGKKVDVNPGSSPEELDYNKVQTGTFYADIPTVMSMVGSLQKDLIPTLHELRISISSLNNYLTDQKLNSDIKTSISNLNLLSQKLNSMIDENRQSIKELASNSAKLSEETQKFVEENKTDIAASVKEMLDVLTKTDSLLTTVNGFTTEVKEKRNNIGKIVYDEDMYKNLKESVQQVNDLTKLLIQQLKSEGIKVDAKIHIF